MQESYQFDRCESTQLHLGALTGVSGNGHPHSGNGQSSAGPAPQPASSSGPPTYEATPSGLQFNRQRGNRTESFPLTNFVARITKETILDDGSSERRVFTLDVESGGRKQTVQIAASEFASLEWVHSHVGAGGTMLPEAPKHRDHIVAAIQTLSTPKVERAFAHTGWRRLGEQWAYLHGGGAIGPGGVIPGVDVILPDSLAPFQLPQPPTGTELEAAIQEVLGFIALAPTKITFPLLATVFRSVLRQSDFSVFLIGPTGVFKSELQALVQQFFGSGFSRTKLPANWSSTDNALEALGHAAKDAILCVDDFRPTGSQVSRQNYHAKADRLLRAQGNSAGRQRLTADTTLRPTKWPRGLIVSSGEEVPEGHSCRARMAILELRPGQVSARSLEERQKSAADGHYAKAMAALIQWLAGRYEQVQSEFHGEFPRLRGWAQSLGGAHARTPSIVADLLLGFWYFTRFAMEMGGISEQTQQSLWRGAEVAIGEALSAQAQFLGESDPVVRYLQLLATILGTGRGHVVDLRSGGPPADAAEWGWTWIGTAWHTRGEPIGALDGNDLFLIPDVAFGAVQALSRQAGETSLGTSTTLHRLLDGRGLILSKDQGRGFMTRRFINGARTSVLHLSADSVRSAS